MLLQDSMDLGGVFGFHEAGTEAQGSREAIDVDFEEFFERSITFLAQNLRLFAAGRPFACQPVFTGGRRCSAVRNRGRAGPSPTAARRAKVCRFCPIVVEQI